MPPDRSIRCRRHSCARLIRVVDNASFGKHGEALEWLARNFSGTLNVATGYIGLNGLETLARIATGRDGGGRLLIGAAPSSESLTGPAEIITDRFGEVCRNASAGAEPLGISSGPDAPYWNA